jgi:hypothetical protein
MRRLVRLLSSPKTTLLPLNQAQIYFLWILRKLFSLYQAAQLEAAFYDEAQETHNRNYDH